jgi:hypothetical protein
MLEDDVDRMFERLSASGDLTRIHVMLGSARALVERELLKKLAHFPVGSADDVVAFAYRQGWLRALVQIEGMFEPSQPSTLRDARKRSLVEEIAFADEAL